MPFAGFKNFAACVRANRNQENPEAYCASIMHAVEDKGVTPVYEENKRLPVYGQTHPDGKIEINPKMGDVVNTIIHEELHNADWGMEHEKVYEMSRKIEGQMSLPEMAQKLLDTHEKMMNPPYVRERTHTTASKVVSQKIKGHEKEE